MPTFLFDDIIFGPVRSRRLGASLGVNLLPVTGKLCNFDCIYCECGWSHAGGNPGDLPARGEIRSRLETRLTNIRKKNSPLDVITFAGNGEPTVHPEFTGIIDDTISLRDHLAPGVRIAVLSNASGLDDPEVFSALGRIEMNILKLDSAFEETVRLINQPPPGYSIDRVVEGMLRYNGRFILQTLFVRGEFLGRPVDNAAPAEIDAWLEIVRKVKPMQVMVYTIERDTPVNTLHKIGRSKLEMISSKVRALGIPVQVSH